MNQRLNDIFFGSDYVIRGEQLGLHGLKCIIFANLFCHPTLDDSPELFRQSTCIFSNLMLNFQGVVRKLSLSTVYARGDHWRDMGRNLMKIIWFIRFRATSTEPRAAVGRSLRYRIVKIWRIKFVLAANCKNKIRNSLSFSDGSGSYLINFRHLTWGSHAK